MAIELTKFHMPTKFEAGEIIKDTRFQKVKIWIAHTGENLNNTYFTKDLLTEMISTLPNIPIVGFVEKNDDNEDDFSDHRSSIVVEKGKVEIRYEGVPFGAIPQEPNAKFEFRGGKEWLTAEGFLWTKFTKSIDIFGESNGIKSQSMEIQDVDGQVDDLGRVIFSKGRFSALCILGEDVSPAMTGSTIEFFSTEQVAKDSIREMIQEFSLQKGDLDLPDKVKKKKVEEEVELTEETPLKPLEPSTETEPLTPLEEETPVKPESEPETDPTPEEATVVSEEVEIEEVSSEENSESSDIEVNEEEAEVEAEVEADTSESEAEEFSKLEKFELSHEGLRKNLQQSIRTKYSEEDISVYVLEVFDNHFYSEFYDWNNDTVRYVKTSYSRNGDVVSLDGEEEVFAMFVTGGEKSDIEANRTKIAELELAIKELQDYKDAIEHSAKEELLESYSSILDSQELKDIRDKFSAMSVEEIEKEIAYTHFQKNKNTDGFSGTGARTLSLGATKETGKYGALSEYFMK